MGTSRSTYSELAALQLHIFTTTYTQQAHLIKETEETSNGSRLGHNVVVVSCLASAVGTGIHPVAVCALFQHFSHPEGMHPTATVGKDQIPLSYEVLECL
jgi:hypothetical protein